MGVAGGGERSSVVGSWGGGSSNGICVIKLVEDGDVDRGDACDGMCERTSCTTLLLGLGGLIEPAVGRESAWKLGVKGVDGVGDEASGWGRAPHGQNQRGMKSQSHCIVGLTCTTE